MPFAPVSWWAHAAAATGITFDNAEHFEKMSYRNRYRIQGANNPVQLSIPLVAGRDQRTPMAAVAIASHERWQVQHWRTLVSIYRRSPFWEYYEPSLAELFNNPFTELTAFNLASYQWVARQLKLSIPLAETDTFVATCPAGTSDLRHMKPATEQALHARFPHYYQVFADRIGFQPNLSILDLLFSEGPATLTWLREHYDTLTQF